MSVWILKACLLALVAITNSEEIKRDERGILRVHGGCRVKPWRSTCPMISYEYPQQTTHDVRMTWRNVYDKEPHERVVAKFTCSDFELPANPDGTCGDTFLSVEELGPSGRGVEVKYCGSRPGLSIVTEANDMYFIYETGSRGGGRFNCSYQAVYVSSDGQEEPLTKSPFLTHQFEEVDSSEFGSGPAPKKTSCACGTANKVSSRIVNGTITAPNEFPWIAALVTRKSQWQFCGAPIITPWHVLTAAHCTASYVSDGSPLDMAVIVGAHDLKDGVGSGHSQLIGVERLMQHEEYNPQNYFKNDISLLLLERQIQFTPFVGRVCLPTHQLNIDHQSVYIIGWGSQFLGGAGSNLLRKVAVRVLDKESCELEYQGIHKNGRTRVCVYRTSKGGCKGDSGGPVVWVDPETNRYTLIGLVSFGRVCGDEAPSVHSDVGYYLDWIKRNIQASRPTELCTKV